MNRVLVRLATVGRTLVNNRPNALPTVAAAAAVGRPVGALRTVYGTPSAGHPGTTGTTRPDNENSYAHNTMVNDPEYSETVVDRCAAKDWPAVTDQEFQALVAEDRRSGGADQVCDDFLKAVVYAAGRDLGLADALFDGIRGRLVTALPELDDRQLLSVLKAMPLWNVRNAKEPVYFRLWSELDKQCIARHKNWSLNKLLLFMDHWYLMKLCRLSDFVTVGIKKLMRKPSRLTPKQLVQTMFYTNIDRTYTQQLPMYDIEHEIFSSYNEFTVKELGILSLGFFKTQTPIRDQELVKKLYDSVISEIANINSMNLTAFLKILRYCTKHKNSDSMYKLMDVLVKKVDEVSLMCCVHMALLGTNLLIKHEDLLKKISQRAINEISQARVKDLERITLALTMMNYNPQTTPCIFETVINELRSDKRQVEYEHFPRCYIFTLSYLAVNNIFPFDCISKAFEVESLQKCFGKKLSKFTIPQDVLCLNNSVVIECPDYTGPLLSDKLRETCNQHLAWYVPTLNNNVKKSINDQHFLKLHEELVNLLKNESYVHACYPLPHHPKSDILFCIDTEGKPVTIPETMKNRTVLNGFQKPPELGKWFALMVLVRNSLLYYSNEYNGLTVCKARQLKRLGYEPITFNPKELTDLDLQSLIVKKLQTYGVTLNCK